MSGERAIVGDALRQAGGALREEREKAEGAQLPMFPVPTRHTGARAEHVQRALQHRHGPGRPAGSENWSNKQLREYLLGRGKHPLANLMEWSLHTPTTLAAELGCTRLEAMRELRMIWEALAPFFAGKVGFIDEDGRPAPMLVMQVGAQATVLGGVAPWTVRERLVSGVEENQGVTVEATAVSHGLISHGPPK